MRSPGYQSLILTATLGLLSACGATETTGQAATTCCLATRLTSEPGVIAAAAVRTFQGDYAGLGLVDGQLVVFTTGTIPQDLPDDLEGIPIATARYNLTELDAFKARVDEAADDLIAGGVRLVSWGVDRATNSVSVGVASDLTAAEATLRNAVGSDVRRPSMPNHP